MTWHVDGPLDGPSSILYPFSLDFCCGQVTWGGSTTSLIYSHREATALSCFRSLPARGQQVFLLNVTCRRKKPVRQTVQYPGLAHRCGELGPMQGPPMAVNACLLKSQESQRKSIAKQRFELISPKPQSYCQLQKDKHWKCPWTMVLTHVLMGPLHVPAC